MKKIYIVVLVLAVGAGVALWLSGRAERLATALQNRKYAVTLPANFPKDFPLDETARPVSTEPPQSGILEYKTNLQPQQAMLTFEAYAKDHGWQVTLKHDNPFIATLNLKNAAGDDLGIVVKLGNDSKSVVSAAYIKK